MPAIRFQVLLSLPAELGQLNHPTMSCDQANELTTWTSVTLILTILMLKHETWDLNFKLGTARWAPRFRKIIVGLQIAWLLLILARVS
jgi:hypothetical protein